MSAGPSPGGSADGPTLRFAERGLAEAVRHLRSRDRRLRRIIDRRGPIDFKPGGDIFERMVESILSQQLAGAAASSIISRLKMIYAPNQVSADRLLATPRRSLRRAGVSPQKVSYLRDLARRVSRGSIDLDSLPRMEDNEVIRLLDEVRGVGPWTVHMLLIFALGRPDILPVDDLGIRKAVQRVYGLRKLPDAKAIEEIARPWHPYCSVASLYLWLEKDGRDLSVITPKV